MNYYKVTQIEFDFDYEDLTQEEQDEIVSETKNCLWDSPDGEECLVDVIKQYWLVYQISALWCD